MADTITTENETDAQSATVASGAGPKTNKIIIGRNFSAFGRDDNRIDYINIGPNRAILSNWKIKNGSLIKFFGQGLESYNQISLWLGSTRELITKSDQGFKIKPDGSEIEFVARFRGNTYSDKQQIKIELQREDSPENDRELEQSFYFAETKQDEEQKTSKSEGGDIKDEPQKLANVLETQGRGSEIRINTKSGAIQKSSSPIQAKQNLSDNSVGQDENDQEEVVSGNSGLSVSEASEVVGEYITKNPEVIVDAQVRQEVLTSLASGNIQTLSESGKVALTVAAQSQQSSSQSAGSERLSGAFKTIIQQTGESTAQISSNTTVEARVSGQGIRGESETGVEVEARGQVTSGQQGGQPRARATVTAKYTGGASPVNLKESRELTGEFLTKNPDLISDVNIRQEVITALESGNLAGLSALGKQGLQSVVEKMQTGDKPSQIQAGQIISQELNKGTQQDGGINGESSKNSASNALKVKTLNSDKQNAESPKEPKNVAVKVPKGADGISAKLKANDVNFRKKNLSTSANVAAGKKPLVVTGQKKSGESDEGAEINNASEVSEEVTEAGSQIQGQSSGQVGSPPLPQQPPGLPIQPPPLPGADDQEGSEQELGQPEPGYGPSEKSEDDKELKDDAKEGEGDESGENPEEELPLPGAAESLEQKIPKTPAELESEINLLVKEINLAIDAELLPLIVGAWTFAIPSFGGTLLAAAFAGDMLWLFKNGIIKGIAKRFIKSDELKAKTDEILGKLLSWRIKLNIIAFNLASALVMLLLAIIVIVALKVICLPTSTVPGLPSASDFGQLCESVNQVQIGSLSDVVSAISGQK